MNAVLGSGGVAPAGKPRPWWFSFDLAIVALFALVLAAVGDWGAFGIALLVVAVIALAEWITRDRGDA